MNIHVSITLDPEDLENSSLQEALLRAIGTDQVGARVANPAPDLTPAPTQEPAPAQDTPDLSTAISNAAETGEYETPTQSTSEVDSAGVPWCADIHSSNRKKYQSGDSQGRWQWRKGVDRDAAEQKAQQLAIENGTAVGPGQAAPGHGPSATTSFTPSAENAAPQQPQGQPAANFTPSPENASPSPEHVQTAGEPWTWTQFIQAMGPAGLTGAEIEPVAQKHGVSDLIELANHPEVFAQVAEELGMQKQG